jgi:HEAT repeat protein
MSLWNSLRLSCLGLICFGFVAFPSAANARPEREKLCYRVLEEHPEIPEAKYLDIVKDSTLDYRLRECAGEQYAMRHPESVYEFINLLSVRPARQISIMSLGRMGPKARPAVPSLLLVMENDNLNQFNRSLIEALRTIGVVDRKSINKLLGMVIKKSAISDTAIEVLSKQKTLPAYVGDVVIAELDKNGEAGREFPGIHEILIPVRTPKAIERYVEITRNRSSGDRSEFGYFKYKFQEIGTAAIPALVNNFRKHNSLNSKTFSVIMLMGMDMAESVQAGRQLAQKMLPLLLAELEVVKSPVTLSNEPLDVSINRIRRLGAIVQPLGKELLALMKQADEARMRLNLIWALMDIKYTDALPALRRLANEDSDAEVRSTAAQSVKILEEILKNATDTP